MDKTNTIQYNLRGALEELVDGFYCISDKVRIAISPVSDLYAKLSYPSAEGCFIFSTKGHENCIDSLIEISERKEMHVFPKKY